MMRRYKQTGRREVDAGQIVAIHGAANGGYEVEVFSGEEGVETVYGPASFEYKDRIAVPADVFARGMPSEGDGAYLVIYDDDHVSWCPKRQFELAYKLVGRPIEQLVADKDFHPGICGLLEFFTYAYLPDTLHATCRNFASLAVETAEASPYDPETTVALRKLLEAKDAAVRAKVRWLRVNGTPAEAFKRDKVS